MMDRTADMYENIIHNLIADFPWLLNLNFEVIPRLRNKGVKFPLDTDIKVDLLLKDISNGRPVFIEIKMLPFHKNHIEEVLEKKDNIVYMHKNNHSVLNNLFEDELLSPIMILVIPNCTDEDKMLCSQSDIEVFEYNKLV